MWKLIEMILSFDSKETLIIVWPKISDLIRMAVPPENYSEMKTFEQFQEKLKNKIINLWPQFLQYNWRIKSDFCRSLPQFINVD